MPRSRHRSIALAVSLNGASVVHVVASPRDRQRRALFPAESPHDVTIGIERADCRNLGLRYPSLSPGLAQQIGRSEDRRCCEFLVCQDRRL
jgi:hypothetical protein